MRNVLKRARESYFASSNQIAGSNNVVVVAEDTQARRSEAMSIEATVMSEKLSRHLRNPVKGTRNLRV
jgi:hypothetical protein